MKEQRIIVTIDAHGRITADAEGFSGGACLGELDRLLEGLAPGKASVTRKPDSDPARLTTARAQTVGKKP